MVKEKICRCGRILKGLKKLCDSCKENEIEYLKLKRKVNQNIDEELGYA